ncbi:MAG: hypothetical protein ACR2LL_00570 [Nitrosopumilus sp.]|nr:hypothetical protein [Nitrosopumilus sp.]
MDESAVSSFFMWSIVTAIVMTITGLTYRAYLKKKNHEVPST